MDALFQILSGIVAEAWFPVVFVFSAITLSGLAIKIFFQYFNKANQGHFKQQIFFLIFSVSAIIAIIVVLPISEALRSQLLSLLGILLSAAIALSSTTFIGNVMAAIMLRVVNNFKVGDFVSIDGQFGRVTEVGLLHTEIQTENRNLTTLPNLMLVNQPLTVIRSAGTIISVDVSLGYDVSRKRIEHALLDAVKLTDLQDGFVQIVELNDFSVSYRVAGLLLETKQILSSRSRLRANVLDSLHHSNIEIVSPSFMNQRKLDPGGKAIPDIDRFVYSNLSDESVVIEELMFDKAEKAETRQRLKKKQTTLQKEIEALKKETGLLGDKSGDERLMLVIDRKLAQVSRIKRVLSMSLEDVE